MNKRYDEYLQTRHWQIMRGAKLILEDYACQKCGRTDCQLEVHHLTYERLGRENIRLDLMVLCHNCHEKHHFFNMPLTNTPEEERLRKRMIEVGRTVDDGSPWD